MSGRDICETLESLSGYQEVVNSVALKDMPIKKVCKIATNSVQAWATVMDEFNDVITTLEGAKKAEDMIYRAAFGKALEIVMRANKFRRERSGL